MIGPTLGSLMLAAGWRPIFGIQAAGGVVLVLAVLAGFTESHPRPDPAALAPSRLARNYGRVLSHRAALAYSLIAALSFGGLFSYVAGSPFVFIAVLGLAPRWFGLVFAATACGLMTGSFLGGRLASHGVPSTRLLPAALCLSLLCTACLLSLAVSHRFGVAGAVPLLIVNMVACGVIIPTAVHGALEPFPATAGVASAVRGCLQMLTGAVASAMVAQLYRGTPVAMTLVMAVCAAASLIAWIVLPSPLLNLNARTT
jgi:DHA1 family bicyclomycin/chloramphenicol resistance-like MFS transporter